MTLMGTRASVIPAAFARVLAATSAEDALCPREPLGIQLG